MRCFIAIELSEAAKSALSCLQKDIRKSLSNIRWVKPANIHLTLKFLGDIDESSVDAIIDSIKGTCSAYSAFRLTISGIGVFPNLKSPRVFWVGINGNDTLPLLQQDIDSGMAGLGFKKEKRGFVPHLTVGRFRAAGNKRDLRDMLESKSSTDFGIIEVDSVSLIKSELKPSGAEYTRIADFRLQMPD